jgi:hypothetical protein
LFASIAAARFSKAKTRKSLPGVGSGSATGAAAEGAGRWGLALSGGVEAAHAPSKSGVNSASVDDDAFCPLFRMGRLSLCVVGGLGGEIGLEPVDFGLHGGRGAGRDLGALAILRGDRVGGRGLARALLELSAQGGGLSRRLSGVAGA